MRVRIGLDDLDALAVGAQHRGETVDHDFVVVDDRETDGHGPNDKG